MLLADGATRRSYLPAMCRTREHARPSSESHPAPPSKFVEFKPNERIHGCRSNPDSGNPAASSSTHRVIRSSATGLPATLAFISANSTWTFPERPSRSAPGRTSRRQIGLTRNLLRSCGPAAKAAQNATCLPSTREQARHFDTRILPAVRTGVELRSNRKAVSMRQNPIEGQ